MDRATVRRRYFWLLSHTLNRVTTRLARRGVGPFSLVRHVGRRSGRAYETPVILARTHGGFVAELTYGDTVDWYRNVVAAGGCEVVHRGRRYRIDGIEPCSPERGRRAYPTPFRQILKLAGKRGFRFLRVAGDGDDAAAR